MLDWLLMLVPPSIGAAVLLLLTAACAYWWSRDRPSLRDLGAMSAQWLQSKDRHRELPPR